MLVVSDSDTTKPGNIKPVLINIGLSIIGMMGKEKMKG